MPSLKINLLDNQRKEILKRQQVADKFNKILMAIAAASLVFTGGTFWYRQNSKSKLADMQSELNRKERQVKDYQQIMDENAKLVTKLAVIGGILDARALLDSKLELFYKIFTSSDIQLREVGFGDVSSNNELEIGGNVGSVFGLIDFFAQMDTYAIEDNISTVTLDSLSRSEDRSYRFNYLLELSPEELE